MHRRVRLAPSVVVGLALLASATTVSADDETDARIETNETTAVAALEAIRAAQERFKAARAADVDTDGVGEFGLLRELSGVYAVRTRVDGTGTGNVLDPPMLSATFRHKVTSDPIWGHWGTGEIVRSGYLFRVILPGQSGFGVVEVGAGALPAPVNMDLAETTWCCYAWPVEYGESGRRSFFINQTGTIVATEQMRYSGSRALAKAPLAGAAMRAGGPVTHITDEVAVDTTGRDGNYWRLVTPRPQVVRRIVDRGAFRGFYGHPLRRARGSFVLRSCRTRTDTVETAIVRAEGLFPLQQYDVTLVAIDGFRQAPLGRLRADDSGRAELRFDSRTDRFVDGFALTDFSSGWIQVERAGDFTPANWSMDARLRSFPRTPEAPSAIRIETSEAAAVATLRQIAQAQSQFAAGGYADVDQDGVGEYGLFRELSGTYAVRQVPNGTGWGGVVVDPPFLPIEFGTFTNNNEVDNSGYLLHMILPGASGMGVIEVATGALAATLDSDLAESTWCCYAWPKKYGVTGRRTYFVNQEGAVTTTESPWYSGTRALGTAALAGAAFNNVRGPLTSITGQVAISGTGRDANRWRGVTERPDERHAKVNGALTPAVPDSAALGTFEIESRQLRTVTDDLLAVDAAELPPNAPLRLVLATESGDVRADAGTTTADDRGRARFTFDSRRAGLPGGVATLTVFAGGTVEVLDDADTVLLRGVVPHLATLAGPNEPGASLRYRAAVVLAPGPYLRLKRGLLDVRATADANGTREEMTLTFTTFDRLAERADVVAVAGDVETPIGTIRLAGDRGAGVLRLDTARGDAMPGGSLQTLAGQRIEVRDTTGAVLLTGTFPSVE